MNEDIKRLVEALEIIARDPCRNGDVHLRDRARQALAAFTTKGMDHG